MDNTTDSNVEGLANDFADKAKDAAEHLSEQAAGWMEQANECVRKHPMTCLLAAVGVGALASFLVCRR